MLTGLAHVDLACRDVERSVAFYLAVLGPLGLQAPPVTFEGERDETIHYLRFPVAGSGSIGLRAASVEQEFALYAPGLHHVAFAVATPDDVRVAHEGACARARRSCTRQRRSRATTPTTTRRSSSTRTASAMISPERLRATASIESSANPNLLGSLIFSLTFASDKSLP